ncbi:MAG UNVERIFIED_CONTAM: hypothetical protein LVR18_13925 [Planctomycetaceae bacterium]
MRKLADTFGSGECHSIINDIVERLRDIAVVFEALWHRDHIRQVASERVLRLDPRRAITAEQRFEVVGDDE